MVTEVFCYKNEPLPIGKNQFEILTRAFRNFIVVVTSKKITTSSLLQRRFSKVHNLCDRVGRTLMVTFEEETVGVFKLKRTPALLNIIHGVYIEYEGNMQEMKAMTNWINTDASRNVKIAREVQLEEIIKREDLVLALFTDESHPSLDYALIHVLQELEDIFGLVSIEVTDPNIAAHFSVTSFPMVLIFEGSAYTQCPVDLQEEDPGQVLDSERADQVKSWIVDKLEEHDRIVVQAISSEAFKNQPNDFKHVLFKEHKDSMRKLSMEYARLAKENEELKDIIKGEVHLMNVHSTVNGVLGAFIVIY